MTTPSSPTPPPTPDETPVGASRPVGAPPPSDPPDWGRQIQRGAEELGRRAEGLGREAEAAAKQWNPTVKRTADTAGRLWGLVLLGVGLWFLADVTLGYDMPRVAWREVWPLILIAIGAVILVRGLARRT